MLKAVLEHGRILGKSPGSDNILVIRTVRGWVLGVRRLSQGCKPVRKRHCSTGHAAVRRKAIGSCCCSTQ